MLGELRVRGGIFMGNQLRPHARNMLIGIQTRAVTASHTVLILPYTLLSVATAPGPGESFLDDRDEPVHFQKPQ